MTERTYNRPFIDGQPVQGPEPFMTSMTLVEGIKIGSVDKDHWQDKHWTSQQIAHLAAMRALYPIDLSENAQPVSYPKEVETFEQLPSLSQFRIKRSVR